MTKYQKERLEAKVRVLWKDIDRCEPFSAECEKLCAELHGIKYALDVMGYAVMCEADGQTRRIVTVHQFSNLNS